MPFGLTNAPATFQRLMESCLGELHLEWCIIYLDDIIIFSKNPDDHITHLEGVFEKLAKARLKLKPSKCKSFKSSLKPHSLKGWHCHRSLQDRGYSQLAYAKDGD